MRHNPKRPPGQATRKARRDLSELHRLRAHRHTLESERPHHDGSEIWGEVPSLVPVGASSDQLQGRTDSAEALARQGAADERRSIGLRSKPIGTLRLLRRAKGLA